MRRPSGRRFGVYMSEIVHAWTPLTVNGVHGEVSADTPKRDGIRITPTMREALAIAAAEGAVLAPPRVLDARWEAADLKNRIHTQKLWLGEDDAVLQSERIDQDVADFTAEHGRPPVIVGNACKSWTMMREDDGVCELYGLFVPASKVFFRSGQYWGEGLPVYFSESDETDDYIVQRSRDTNHNDRHHDYYTGLILWRPLRTGPSEPPDTDPDPPPRITSLDERGAAVRAWQAFVGALVDSWHGPITEALTVDWLKEHPETTRQSTWPPDTIPGPPPSALIEPVDDFIQAKNFTVRRRELDSVRVIVLHSTENDIAPGVARNVARWFAGPQAPKASAHYVVGPDETLGCVKLRHTAWAAPGANADGVQVELVGRAFKTEWLGDGREVLENGAELVAWLCQHLGLPVRRVTVDGLLRGERGIVTHAAVTAAYRKSTHVDPGLVGDKRWPWAEFLGMVEAATEVTT